MNRTKEKEIEMYKRPQTEPLSLWHQSYVKILFYNNGNGSLTNVLKVPLLTHQPNKILCWLINTWYIIMILIRCITTFGNIFTAVFFFQLLFLLSFKSVYLFADICLHFLSYNTILSNVIDLFLLYFFVTVKPLYSDTVCLFWVTVEYGGATWQTLLPL